MVDRKSDRLSQWFELRMERGTSDHRSCSADQMGAVHGSHRNRIASGMLVGAIFSVLIVFLAGCSLLGKKAQPLTHHSVTELITVHYTVADTLYSVLSLSDACKFPMLMSSFVNLDDLDQTSPLGRIVPQQIGSRFVQHGMHLVDVRMRADSLLIRKDHGEFALSRELAKLNSDVDAYSVLTGTYSVVYDRVYITAMVVRSTDGTLLASLDYFLPVDRKSLNREKMRETSSSSDQKQLPDPFHGTVMPSVLTRL